MSDEQKKAVVAFIALLPCALTGRALAQGPEIEFMLSSMGLARAL
jgi:hypothetical protein